MYGLHDTYTTSSSNPIHISVCGIFLVEIGVGGIGFYYNIVALLKTTVVITTGKVFSSCKL